MFDKVELVNYSVLLSYPNTSNPNSLQLFDGKGQLLYNAHSKQEPPLTPGEDDPNVAPPFNAYCGSGKVTVSKNFCLESVGLSLRFSDKSSSLCSTVTIGSTENSW